MSVSEKTTKKAEPAAEACGGGHSSSHSVSGFGVAGLSLQQNAGNMAMQRAMQAGAQGYVLKNSTGEDLVPALRAVAGGAKWIPREIATRLASRIPRRAPALA